jgi:hypothetical protein
VSAPVDLWRYHDLTRRLAAFAVDGGAHLRGDREDVQIVDAEPHLAPDEREHARLAGFLRVFGTRTTSPDDETPSLGLVLEASGMIVVTTQRLIIAAERGASQLGPILPSEIHTFVMPWDLVDSISRPKRTSWQDRLAGARPIEFFCATRVILLSIIPAKRAEIDGREQRVTEDDAMRILVKAAVQHRTTVSPAIDQPRLGALLRGAREIDEGEEIVQLSRSEPGGGTPMHLVGRLVVRREVRHAAAALLLLDDE